MYQLIYKGEVTVQVQSKQEFDSLLSFTNHDWQNYIVKRIALDGEVQFRMSLVPYIIAHVLLSLPLTIYKEDGEEFGVEPIF